MEQIAQCDPNDEVCKILVGNKCDLDSERQVSTEQGHNLAEEFGVDFLETSAKDNSNIDELFLAMSQKMVQRAGPPDQGKDDEAAAKPSLQGQRIGDKKKCC